MANTPEFISDVQARIRSFENSYEEHMATHRAQQADLERLREAKKKLQSHLEEMDTLKGLKTGVERMNKTAKATQNICATDTRNMKAIATKIVEEDKAMANILKENTVRFQ